MTTDIIVTWPDNCDYPLWRRYINGNRGAFRDVIIVIMKTNNGFNYGDFIKNQMGKTCKVVDSPEIVSGADWRDVAVNYALRMSRADRVWFTEQDFIPHNGFWEDVNKQTLEGCQVLSVYDHYRMHPCCIFADRNIIEETRKNFGIVPQKFDHFYLFQEDIDNLFYDNKIILGVIENHYEHLNGLSSNYMLMTRGEEPNYQPERFKKYIEDSLQSGVVLHPEFVRVCEAYLNKK